MSVDIAWETITSGPDGQLLSGKIRDFIHEKFQQIQLPRFINAVHVHSFEFGSRGPEIEIKDICDPLPDFYEDDTDEDDDHEPAESEANPVRSRDDGDSLSNYSHVHTHTHGHDRPHDRSATTTHAMSPIHENAQYEPARALTAALNARIHARTDRQNSIDTQGHLFPRSSTPGIPGGTSNLSYFHLPVGGFSGAQTPLAALAGGTPFSPGWQHETSYPTLPAVSEGHHDDQQPYHHQRSDSISTPEMNSPYDPASPESRPVYAAAEKVSDELNLDSMSLHSTLREEQVDPSDLQVVARVNYDGDIRLTLTAEILLDYPMPSFVGIPLRLSVTGLKFDGIAIVAYIKKRMHFCFLDPDDAQTLVGDQIVDTTPATKSSKGADAKSTFGSLLREVQIESEIGRQESGKQVLKNVGKVEKFVLEQVKKIFEEEFVFPSFWTFLV